MYALFSSKEYANMTFIILREVAGRNDEWQVVIVKGVDLDDPMLKYAPADEWRRCTRT